MEVFRYCRNSRTQLPRSLVLPINVHKSKGETLHHAAVSFGDENAISDIVYIGLSRIKKNTSLLFETCAYLSNFLRTNKNILHRKEFIWKFQ